jgi:hypothetical protein
MEIGHQLFNDREIVPAMVPVSGGSNVAEL